MRSHAEQPLPGAPLPSSQAQPRAPAGLPQKALPAGDGVRLRDPPGLEAAPMNR